MAPDLTADKPGVIIFPPLIGLIDVALGLLLDYLAPLGFVANSPFLPRFRAMDGNSNPSSAGRVRPLLTRTSASALRLSWKLNLAPKTA